jgi:anti-anti-sigma factor
MIPQGVEVRPELQVRNDVQAYGFSGKRVPDHTAVSLLGGVLLDYVPTTSESVPTGLVVVDMRNVDSLSTTGLGRLLALHKRLGQVRWKVVLLIGDPIVREVFSATQLDRRFLVAADEGELRELVQCCQPVSVPAVSPGEWLQFGASELAEMEAGGITLDDAIRAIELSGKCSGQL